MRIDSVELFRVELPLHTPYITRLGTIAAIETIVGEVRAADGRRGVGDATIVETVPTLLSMHIEDRQQGGSSDLKVSAVSYDTAVKDALFDPVQLPEVAAQMHW